MNDSSKQFEYLRERYAHSLADKREALAQARDAFDGNPEDDALRRELCLQIHRLCGSAFAYGYERIGDRARVVDNLVRDWELQPEPLRITPKELSSRIAEPLHALLHELDSVAWQGDRNGPLRVVLVDDDPSQAALTGAALEARGCAVRIESGSALLAQTLREWPCHAVVLDYWLRGETGGEIAAALRRDPGFARLALVCYTDEPEPQVLRSALDAGCDVVLAKSAGADRLYDTLRACVAQPDRFGDTTGRRQR